ncbi:hypothetical protein D3C83_158090 [compost metagenome]
MRKSGMERARVMTRVRSSGAVADRTMRNRSAFGAAVAGACARWIEYTKSCAVTWSPFDQKALPGR